MKRSIHPPKPLDLGKFTTGKTVVVDSQEWEAICHAQKAGHIRVKPLSRYHAWVRITPAGIMNLALGAVE